MTGFSEPSLRIRPALTEQDFEEVRRIRNECRLYMTRNRGLITKEEQAEWMQTRPYLRILEVNDEIAGFGLVTSDDEGDWLTGALREKFRGKGYGRFIFQELIKRSERPMLEVLGTNDRAYHLYLSLGFIEVGRSENVIRMIYGR